MLSLIAACLNIYDLKFSSTLHDRTCFSRRIIFHERVQWNFLNALSQHLSLYFMRSNSCNGLFYTSWTLNCTSFDIFLSQFFGSQLHLNEYDDPKSFLAEQGGPSAILITTSRTFLFLKFYIQYRVTHVLYIFGMLSHRSANFGPQHNNCRISFIVFFLHMPKHVRCIHFSLSFIFISVSC